MPWKEVSVMDAREEFVILASKEGANVRELCRRFQIGAASAYKWIGRYAEAGRAGLHDRSRRPKGSPARSAPAVEARIVALRREHPHWGARKLCARLHALQEEAVPSVSTAHAILKRHGLIDATQASQHSAFTRFEHEHPNALWQMDFKGHFALGHGRCHPLTVLDDHSRYNLCLQACANEQGASVQGHLSTVFRRYGLPLRLAVDNGPPWGEAANSPYTALSVWLIRLGIALTHSRPYHPQTLGKDERFHRSLKLEVLSTQHFADLAHAQARFDAWRHCYNHERPHQALGMQVPAARYHASARTFPEALPAIEYADPENVRKVQDGGLIHYQGRVLNVSRAFHRYAVAVRANHAQDGLLEVFFCHQKIASFNLHDSK